MNVTITNNGAFDHNVVVYDENAGHIVIWNGVIPSHQTINVSCQVNDAGYGNLQTVSDGVAVNRDLLDDGDSVWL